MMLKIFSVYDSKAKIYARPFYDNSIGSALRSFADIAKDKTHPIGAHPEDYVLFQVGEWDDQKCLFTLLATPVSLGVAIELLPQSPADLRIASNG